MIELIITKVVIFALCFASLNIIREIWTFIQCYMKTQPYEVGNHRMFGLWVSISFIMTIILTGII